MPLIPFWLVNARASWPVAKPVVMDTLPETRLVPPLWVTVKPPSITTAGLFSVNAVVPPVVVIAGGGTVMVMVNDAVEAGKPTPFEAVTMQPFTVVAPGLGVPEIWLPTRLKPLGSVQPESASVGVGKPVTVNVPEPATPTLKVEFEMAEIVGA